MTMKHYQMNAARIITDITAQKNWLTCQKKSEKWCFPSCKQTRNPSQIQT